MKYATRASWGARPASSVVTVDPARLLGVTVHWYGSPRAVSREADFEAQLRAVQRAHQLGEFDDIAYNFVVSPWGVIYEGRGFGRQTGANGTSFANQNYASVVVAIGKGDRPSRAAQDAVARVIAGYRARGAGGRVVPHGYWTGSECPGPDMRAWIAAGGYEAPSAPEEEEPMQDWIPGFVRWYTLDRRDSTRPKDAPSDIPADVWKLIATVADVHLRLGPPPVFQAWRDARLLGGDSPAATPLPVPGGWWDAAVRDHAFANSYAEKVAQAIRSESASQVATLQGRVEALMAEMEEAGASDGEREERLRALLEEALTVLEGT